MILAKVPTTGLTLGDYADFLERFGIDLVAVLLFALVIYLRRHKRRDLFLAYTFFNVGLFVVLAVITSHTLPAAAGFGLFAILSIVRLRSEPFTNLELGYLFIALVLALVNGTGQIDKPYVVLLNTIVLMTVFLVDHPRLNPALQFRTLALDSVHTDSATLKAELESSLGVEIYELSITDVDYVRDITRVSIRYVELKKPPGIEPVSAKVSTGDKGNGVVRALRR